ncbi:MAG TPA: DNRLRE domain-containing protein [Jatrophihabitans sp.]|jgi:fibronectin type 3 domain-containing protein|uniref:CBM96 family carbohydrate-binding protein n=1 Tax=Jatrophihabitans sp. TaxID=1932789 RepID=UPI002E0429BF|nr:DNRLRE domain-containing protein [Jatrophihabitans sp.]
MQVRSWGERGRRSALVGLLLATSMAAVERSAAAAPVTALTRYPYLTDSIQSSITVNWATDTSATTGSVAWGPAGSCSAHITAATRTSITVVSKPEYQWAATIPVTPDTAYCYRPLLGGTDLLGSDPSPVFTSQVAAGSSAPFSFDVFGDWGQAYANGNPDQTNVLSRMATSGARFAVMTGDTAYPGGGQTEYGDLQQAGADRSTVFGPSFWAVPGRSLPVFNVTGNHGFTNGSVQVVNWPEGHAASTSGGRYAMEPYPSINGTTAKNYPSMWYAFDAGGARFYALTAAWSDGNIGTATVYQNDRDQHWTPTSGEYTWLKADLAAHPNAVKFAFWHYPLYADSGGQPSDTFLQGGAGTLQGLLDQNNVALVFNGHAHGYERNEPDPAGMVSYVFGNGGAAMGSVSGCSSFDAYALGSGGSHCGAAPAGLSLDHVFGFAKVTVNGGQVTVAPTDELGRTFDVQTYTVGGGSTDTVPPTAPTTVTATAVTTGRIDVSWSGATDNVGVTGYRVFRDGTQVTDQTGTTFSDRTVAPASTYTYTVVAVDSAGNTSPPSAPATASTTGAPDGTAPSTPGSLTATAPSSSQVNLTWTASTDNVGVVGYNVYRDGVALPGAPADGSPPTAFTDDTAAPGSSYQYQVSAVDAAGNESAKASVTVATPGGGRTLTFTATADTTVDASQPTVNFGTTSRLTVDNSPVNDVLLRFDVSGTAGCTISTATLRLTVGSTPNDNSVYGGDLYGTSTSWTESAVTWNTAPADTGAKVSSVPSAVALNTTYSFDATPLVTGDGPVGLRLKSTSSDGARYFSREGGSPAQVPQLQVVCAGDSVAPSAPGNLTATAPDSGHVALTWSAASDNVGVTGYKVYRNQSATALAVLPGDASSYTDSAVKPATTYTYQVTALDAAGNQSARANTSVTTPASTSVDDFSLTAGPPSVSVTAGGQTTSTISTLVTSGNAQTVDLDASGAPAAATTAFEPPAIDTGQSSTLTITTASSAPAGTYPITVTAVGPTATHTVTVTLTVTTSTTPVQLIQTAVGSEAAAATSLTATFAAPAATGHLLVIAAGVYTGATNHVSSIVDPAGDTWTRAGAYFQSGHNSDGELWFTVASAPVSAVTLRLAAAGSTAFQVLEYSGVVAATPLDAAVGASNTGSSAPSGSLTPPAPHDLVVGFVSGHGSTQTMTISTPGFTVQPQVVTTGTVVTVRTCYQTLSSADPIGITGTFGSAMYWAAGVVAFRTLTDQP